MESKSRQAHWENVYSSKGENVVSWFQESPAASLALIAELRLTPQAAIIDIGWGASRLVDSLIEKGFRDITVLNLSMAALEAAKTRLKTRLEPYLATHSAQVRWIVADATDWAPRQVYDILA
jgi:hypothetical protein